MQLIYSQYSVDRPKLWLSTSLFLQTIKDTFTCRMLTYLPSLKTRSYIMFVQHMKKLSILPYLALLSKSPTLGSYPLFLFYQVSKFLCCIWYQYQAFLLTMGCYGQHRKSFLIYFHFIYSFQPLRPFKAHFWHA